MSCKYMNFPMMVVQAMIMCIAAVRPAAWIELLGAWCSFLLVMRRGSPPGIALQGVFRLELLLLDSKDN